LALPTSVPLNYFGGFMHSVPAAISGISSFATFGGGRTLLGLGIASAAAIANLTESGGQSFMQAQVRTVDGQAASLHVGDKYPILTAYYNTGVAGQTSNIPPAFNFEDLGLVLKVTPHVHGTEETTLETEAEFKVLSGQSVNGIPVISNRKFQCQVRLRTGEWAVLNGMLTSSEAHSISGIAGLASLPGLGPLFRQHTKSRDESELLLLFRPVLLSLPASESPQPALYVGSEARFLTPL
jgi:type II secretory pathway component GspD/PulD (secretin)